MGNGETNSSNLSTRPGLSRTLIASFSEYPPLHRRGRALILMLPGLGSVPCSTALDHKGLLRSVDPSDHVRRAASHTLLSPASKFPMPRARGQIGVKFALILTCSYRHPQQSLRQCSERQRAWFRHFPPPFTASVNQKLIYLITHLNRNPQLPYLSQKLLVIIPSVTNMDISPYPLTPLATIIHNPIQSSQVVLWGEGGTPLNTTQRTRHILKG